MNFKENDIVLYCYDAIPACYAIIIKVQDNYLYKLSVIEFIDIYYKYFMDDIIFAYENHVKAPEDKELQRLIKLMLFK